MASENLAPKQFKYRISSSLIFGLCALIFLIIFSSFTVIWFEGRPKLVELSLDSQTKLGQNISLALEAELQEVKGITMSMAASVTALPSENRQSVLKSLLPKLLMDNKVGAIIAGGGVWPEPGFLQEGVGRKSNFWGRVEDGSLQFFDDYNSPFGPGYRSEEWYVPARVLTLDEVYWSRSYTDPYSLQPMVTCTAPIMDGNDFRGVTTVDLKLEGVSRILNQLIAGLDAYAFIVDRNNRFIVFPTLGFDVSRTAVYSGDNGFQYLNDLVDVYPAFAEISNQLASLDDNLYREVSARKPDRLNLVNRLTEGSYQIGHDEAKRIVAHEWLKEKSINYYPKPLEAFEIQNDILLRGSATGFIYQMPSTHWRIVTVFEQKAYGAISDIVTIKLSAAIILTSILFGLIAFFLLKSRIIDRITRMVERLSHAVQESDGQQIKLDYGANDELGMLAYWYNRRTDQLESAIEASKQANKSKTDFLAGMSQELRTPLNSIIGYNRRLIVKLGGELEEEYYKTLIAIQRSSHHLLSMVDDILEVSELEAGRVQLDLDWEDVNTILEDVSSQMSALASDRELDFETLPLEGDVRFYVDRKKVIQVLIHLVSNALEVTDVGVVRLKAERTQLADSKAVAFSVKDMGNGLSQEEQHVILKQFSQVDDYTGYSKSFGLGLYFIREITSLHQGAVFFESTIGKGSTFKVVFPVNANYEHHDQS